VSGATTFEGIYKADKSAMMLDDRNMILQQIQGAIVARNLRISEARKEIGNVIRGGRVKDAGEALVSLACDIEQAEEEIQVAKNLVLSLFGEDTLKSLFP